MFRMSFRRRSRATTSLLAFRSCASQFNFGPAVLGQTTVSFTALDPHAPSQYIEQWSVSVEKSLGHQTTLEIGYLGSHGVHLQRAHLINNAPPDRERLGRDVRFPKISFVAGSVLPDGVTYIPPVTGCSDGSDLLPSQYHQSAREHGAELV